MKLSQIRTLIKEIVNTELDEMARISSYYSIGDRSKLDILPDSIKKSGKTLRILDFLEKNPGSTMLAVAADLYPHREPTTQMISPPWGILLKTGIIKQDGLTKPKAEKPEKSTEPKILKGDINRAYKNIVKAIKNDEEIAEEDAALIKPELIQALRDAKAKAETKRDVSQEPGVKVIDDREERLAKVAAQNKSLEDAKEEFQKISKQMKDLNAEYKKTQNPEIFKQLKALTPELKAKRKALEDAQN